jgi:hypothetical protein
MKTQLTIPKGLSPPELRKEILRQEANIHKLFQPLLDEVDLNTIDRDAYQQAEFETTQAFLRDVPRQAVQIVYEWVRMDYATAKQSNVRIQFRGNLYEVQVWFKNE